MSPKEQIISLLARMHWKAVRVNRMARAQEREEWENPPEICIGWAVDNVPVLDADLSFAKDPVDLALAEARRRAGKAHLPESTRERIRYQIMYDRHQLKEGTPCAS